MGDSFGKRFAAVVPPFLPSAQAGGFFLHPDAFPLDLPFKR
jgi:hypothetical protein